MAGPDPLYFGTGKYKRKKKKQSGPRETNGVGAISDKNVPFFSSCQDVLKLNVYNYYSLQSMRWKYSAGAYTAHYKRPARNKDRVWPREIKRSRNVI